MVTGIFTFYLLRYTDVSLTMRIPFWGGHYLNLGWLAVPVLFFAVIGTVNGVNFTDGVDGLATSVTLIVAVFFTVVSIGTQSGIEPVTCAVIGGLMGFLLYNVYPASVFMGDTRISGAWWICCRCGLYAADASVYTDRGIDLSG